MSADVGDRAVLPMPRTSSMNLNASGDHGGGGGSGSGNGGSAGTASGPYATGGATGFEPRFSAAAAHADLMRPSTATDRTEKDSVGTYLFGHDVVQGSPFAADPRLSTATGAGHLDFTNIESTDVLARLTLDEGGFGQGRGGIPASSSDARASVLSMPGGSVVEQDRLIQSLCDFSDGFPLLLRETKLSISSTKEAIAVLKKRAEAEEQYAKSMQKVAQMTYKTEGKGGTFATSWQHFGKVHEKIGGVHAKLAESLNEIAEEMTLLQKDTERSRKSLKEGHARRLKDVMDSDAALEKARTKYEQSSEEWERSVITEQQQHQLQQLQQQHQQSHQSGSNSPPSHRKFGMNKGTNPIMMLKVGIEKNFKRTEEDSRAKAATANDNYRIQLQATNAIRNEFYFKYLPQFVKNLKQTLDDADERLCSYMSKYGDIVLRSRLDEDLILNPAGNPREGLVKLTEGIDWRRDLEEAAKELGKAKPVDKNDREYMAYKSNLPGPSQSTSISDLTQPPSPLGASQFPSSSLTSAAGSATTSGPPGSASSAGPMQIFGVDLVALMEGDTSPDPVPHIVTKCIDYIEANGITQQGIYRLSAASGQLQKLKHALDRDPVGLRLDQVVEDIHAVSGVLKLYFRELPDPLIPRHMYRQFVEAARIDDERMRLIQTHELINTLDDVRYATLKKLSAHLSKVKKHEPDNKMTVANLGIIWGPTLLDPPEQGMDPSDMKLQAKVVETIVNNYEQIFDTDG
ncbi:hypothetical protein BC831DRAFT_449068 [Entophlyctis helioformis]|nr:hypothetical protein BC831DRAFT_449068 [Entophlyctis helioformis]